MPPVCWMLYGIHHEDHAPNSQGISIKERYDTFWVHRGLDKLYKDKEKGGRLIFFP